MARKNKSGGRPQKPKPKPRTLTSEFSNEAAGFDNVISEASPSVLHTAVEQFEARLA